MFSAKIIYSLVILFLILLAFVFWQMRAYKVSEPSYSLTKKEGAIEIRHYPSIIIAEVEVSGDRQSAIRTGFRTLADFIFGNNSKQIKISMTAPVIQKGVDTSKTSEKKWVVQFVMPALYSMSNLPQPENKNIKIMQSPEKNYVVIQFRGSSAQANLDKHETQLRDYIAQHNLKVTGKPLYAFYNPPWILPIFRRNEIMLEIEN
jgi:effector-binding domain-containing protein